MGTGEITQGEGWRDRKKPWSNPRGTLKTVSPRGPGTLWVYQARGPLGPEQRPAPDKFMTSLPFRGLQGSGIEAGGKEGEGSQRGLEKNVLEGLGSLLNGLPLPRKVRAEKRSGFLATTEVADVGPFWWGGQGTGRWVPRREVGGSWWGDEEVINAPQMRGNWVICGPSVSCSVLSDSLRPHGL